LILVDKIPSLILKSCKNAVSASTADNLVSVLWVKKKEGAHANAESAKEKMFTLRGKKKNI